MAGATEAQRKQMEAAEAEVRRHMAAAHAQVKEAEDSWLPSTDTDKQVAGAVKMTTATFNLWAGLWKQWALAGVNAETGDDYPVAFWLRIGEDLAKAFATHTKGAVAASAFAVLENTTKATAAEVTRGAVGVVTGAAELAGAAIKEALPHVPLPKLNWKGKAAVGVVGLGALALGGAYVWRAFR